MSVKCNSACTPLRRTDASLTSVGLDLGARPARRLARPGEASSLARGTRGESVGPASSRTAARQPRRLRHLRRGAQSLNDAHVVLFSFCFRLGLGPIGENKSIVIFEETHVVARLRLCHSVLFLKWATSGRQKRSLEPNVLDNGALLRRTRRPISTGARSGSGSQGLGGTPGRIRPDKRAAAFGACSVCVLRLR